MKRTRICISLAPRTPLSINCFNQPPGAPPKLNQQTVPAFGDNRADNDKFPDSIIKRLMENQPVPEKLAQKYLGKSKEAEFVRRLILLAAKNDTPVLIVGATGTGKEVVARQIHECSERGPESKPAAELNP